MTRQKFPRIAILFPLLLACGAPRSQIPLPPLTPSDAVRDTVLAFRCPSLPDLKAKCRIYDVSLIELIARPEVFHGHRVRVIGFALLEFEHFALYVSREDWRWSITKNSVGLRSFFATDSAAIERNINKAYVIVEGTFDGRSFGLSSGGIGEITRFQRWGHWFQRDSADRE